MARDPSPRARRLPPAGCDVIRAMSRRAHLRVLLAAAVALLALAGCGDSKDDPPARRRRRPPHDRERPGARPAVRVDGRPAGRPEDRRRRGTRTPASSSSACGRSGCPALTEEGQVTHIHQHLDLFVDGEEVAVPDDIGIDPGGGFISPLHTHQRRRRRPARRVADRRSASASASSSRSGACGWTPSASAASAPATASSCARGSTARRSTGDPTRIVLDEHQEIVLAYGTPEQMPDPVPSTYEFPRLSALDTTVHGTTRCPVTMPSAT